MSVVSFGQSRPVLIRKVADLVARARIDLSDEKRSQRDLADVFTTHGLDFKREVKLSPRDIVDFMFSDIALEVKLKGSAGKMDIFRQLERYCQSDAVQAIILASNLSMGLPETINGKPCFFITLGRAWI